MVNEQITASIESVDKLPVWQSNPLNLVNGETTQNNNQPWAVKHKSIIDNVVWLIAKITWNPDPFTWKWNITVTPKTETNVVTQTATPEFKPENQTTTTPVKAEESGLFGKFSSTLTNIWNAVEILWNKAVWEATNVVNKGLEAAGEVWEKTVWTATNVVNKWLETASEVWGQAISQAQQVAKQASDDVNNFVKIEEPKKEWSTNIQ